MGGLAAASRAGAAVMTSAPLRKGAALVVIDVQQGLDDPRYGERNNPQAEARMADLLAAWRSAHRPVIHVQHMSVRADSLLRPGEPGNALKREVTPHPGEPLFQKRTNSAFVGTNLERHLRDNGIEELVIVGLTTDHCVSATTRTASDLGFSVTVVEDATATHERSAPDGAHFSADVMHRTALASLNGEFAAVRSTQEVLTELRDDAAIGMDVARKGPAEGVKFPEP